ncbi:phosphatase PAP2 family protein [Natrialba aegyptia]|uniref:Phosphoesterase PA-phosphatase-like protein n=1 Tax=Natrialba aegyptia DSM 13077 TaxID=1227491 RepID=M0B7A5_9EURY|nr:phosphatase PAP2 family protein [Natrialba aegyptia]ELZ06700.1 phosphoesterase PA-phosphatase-like protein [Natrialba aegyptia DSM 13077]
MALISMAVLTALTVLTGLSITCLLCLEPRQIRRTASEFGPRLRTVAPYLGAAALFFVTKRATHEYSVELSHALDWDITAELYAIEGEFVADLQHAVPGATLEFFSVMYMFGFPFLVVTAPILYFLLPSQRHLKELLIAYLLNYFLGAICYTLFIAYGPRNHLSTVDGLMYDFYPSTQDLTGAVSANTDVFPSLHTSLAVVVLVFAWRSRREYPRWFPIAAFVTAGVVFSTMYLGIHWLLDVVAGAALGVGSIYAAERFVDRAEGDAERGQGREQDSVPDSDEEDGITSDVSD